MNDHGHNVEYASAGSPVERADARSNPASAALRNAPAWVRERLAEIPSQAGSDTVVERRGGVEYGTEDRATAYAERSLRNAPAHIRRSVNVARRRRGLTEIAAPRPEPTGPGVWVFDKRTGRLVPASAARMVGTTSRSPTMAAPTKVVERVLILPCPSFTDAPARNLGAMLPETISPRAFGAAADLNREKSFDLRLGHFGARLAIAGQALRAHDTAAGVLIEWIFDPRMPMAREAREAINSGCGVSVALKVHESRTMRLPWPTTTVTRATLLHVALLDEDRPAYPAACAMSFPGSRVGDADELRKQIDKVVAESRFRWRRSS
jgi:hypothetical protein